MNTAGNMCCVVGSGPAGVSCAMALLQKGVKVTLIDVGLELEPARTDQLTRLQTREPDDWQPGDLDFIKEGTSASTSGIPLKRAYGSDYPYQDPGVGWHFRTSGVETHPSFSKGGLSAVWGAAVLPYRSADIQDWPVTESELEKHYRAVHEFVPLAGMRDSLDDLFPLYSETPQPLELSQQARSFLKNLTASSSELKQTGIRFGASRLAVWAKGSTPRSGCRYCGQCMYGCPYEVIYNSAKTLDRLRQDPNFTYRKNTAVDRVAENGNEVTLFAHDVHTRESVQVKASRVFLACGVLPTSKILLESMDAFEREVILRDCFYFLLPLLRFHRSKGASRERLHTLSQVFLEILDPEVCEKTVHLQIYTYNELYSVALRRMFGPAHRLVDASANILLERLMLIQGYLPSDYSPSVRVVLSKDSASGQSTLRLAPIACNRTETAVKNIVRKLRKNSKHLGVAPVFSMLRPGKPGRGFHSGGTFPMRARPSQFESDRWGRPSGFKRVHAVDSTIFPSIPATTITLTVMANAHRIGSNIGEY